MEQLIYRVAELPGLKRLGVCEMSIDYGQLAIGAVGLSLLSYYFFLKDNRDISKSTEDAKSELAELEKDLEYALAVVNNVQNAIAVLKAAINAQDPPQQPK